MKNIFLRAEGEVAASPKAKNLGGGGGKNLRVEGLQLSDFILRIQIQIIINNKGKFTMIPCFVIEKLQLISVFFTFLKRK